ncbi:GNAT family acetyltransferase [Oceanicola sp. 22II-s10i]|uniref:GNAT family N-acetyltransferase n=1 Tax=Oceanicola sp. 22II-s10i TaxID=1317116 RepID=UPI000B525CF0|nr:GNAT family N-acetyltransferase [Oceanicola sp. 22II-s10i]OWU83415.1 GNAT family acetyltransferase [Oceanicola sp. 22II-s10i]
MTDAAVRRAGPVDVPAMAAIANAWVDETDWMPRDMPPEGITRFIRDALPEREIWVAGEPVCGYLSLDPVTLRIGALYVRERGRGVGKTLMDRVKDGRDMLWLHTHVPNLDAQRFYRREGFAEVSRHAAEPPETVPEIRMEWRR